MQWKTAVSMLVCSFWWWPLTNVVFILRAVHLHVMHIISVWHINNKWYAAHMDMINILLQNFPCRMAMTVLLTICNDYSNDSGDDCPSGNVVLSDPIFGTAVTWLVTCHLISRSWRHNPFSCLQLSSKLQCASLNVYFYWSGVQCDRRKWHAPNNTLRLFLVPTVVIRGHCCNCRHVWHVTSR